MASFAYSYFRALRLHPDKGGDPDLFKEVTHAYVVLFILFYLYLIVLSYEILSDEDKRQMLVLCCCLFSFVFTL